MSRREKEAPRQVGFTDSDWEESHTETGRKFYVNRKTGQTSWAIGPLPVGWSAQEDSVGRIYFIEHATNRRTFNDPRLDPALMKSSTGGAAAALPSATATATTAAHASVPVAVAVSGSAAVGTTPSDLPEAVPVPVATAESIPADTCSEHWLAVSASRTGLKFIPGLYQRYLKSGIHLAYGEQIDRDVGRTFPLSPYFSKHTALGRGGLQQLKNVLCAWSLHDPEIGYVQGMNFIVGYILQRTHDEEKAFWLFLRLIQGNDVYGLRGLFTEDLPQIWSMCYQVQRGMERLCPKLLNHFAMLELSGTAWLPQWTMSLFTKYFAPPQLDEFLTLLFDGGLVVLLKMVLSILLCVQDRLLAKPSFGEAIMFLNPPIDSKGIEGVWDCVSPNAALFYVKTMNINAQLFTQWEVEYQEQLSRGATCDEVLSQLTEKTKTAVQQKAAQQAQVQSRLKAEKQRKEAAIGAAVGVGAAVAIGGIIGAILGAKKGR